MSNNTVTAQLFGQLSEFMAEVAAEKTAEANTEAGGYQGATTHPSADVDDSTADAQEGARSAENAADVKADVDGTSPDDLPEASPGSDNQDERQLNIGTQQSATGEDPSVEDDFKGDKDDPGTSHPADTEDGEKYGALEAQFDNASFMEARAAALNLGNDILADFANGYGFATGQTQKVAASENRGTVKNPGATAAESYAAPAVAYSAPQEKQAADLQESADAGYVLASVLGMEKMSEDQRAQATIEQTIKDAHFDADLVGSYLGALANEAEKSGEHDLEDVVGGAVEAEDHDELGDDASGMEEGGDLAPELGEGEDILGALGGGGLGGDEGLEGLGGIEGGGGVGEEDIAAALGGIEGGEPEAPVVGEEESLAQLAAALDELGISPEQLAAAADEGGAKLASAVTKFKRSGKFRHKEATTARDRQIRDLMKAHVLELVG